MSKEFEEQMAKARIRVAHLDRVDGGDRSLGTIWAALDTGLRRPKSGAQYDALVMLEDLTGRTSQRGTRN